MKTAFILNPAAGKGRDPAIYEEAVRSVFGPRGLDHRIQRTERRGHASELARAALEEGFDCVAAIGGDGTINEVARALIHTPAALGVIPKGSGNGFAREFGFPLDPARACATLAESKAMAIDVGRLNGEPFFNVAGFGLDARIAEVFERTVGGGRRGKWPYFKLGFQELRRYRAEPVRLRHDGGEIEATPLLVAAANATQYGSGARIAPRAVINDGLFDLVVVRGAPWRRLFPLALRLFAGTLEGAAGVTVLRSRTLAADFPEERPYHMDGEVRRARSFNAEILPSALNLRVPPGYRPSARRE